MSSSVRQVGAARMERVQRRCLVACTLILAVGCTEVGEPVPPSTAVSFDTTSSGVLVASYPSVPVAPSFSADVDLRLGSEPGIAFGDIRGLEFTSDSLVIVLDHQASEVRSFDLLGNELGLLAKEGQGPTEITSANGLWLDTQGALWINDHGNSRLTRIHPDGEVTTVPFFVRGFSYLWDGGVTIDGRVWSQWSHSDQPSGPREPGVVSGTLRSYYKSVDPTTGEVDSVFVGDGPFRSLVLPMGGAQVPFIPQRLQAIDRTDAIWTAVSDDYRITRLTLAGDTTLVIDVEAERPPVSTEERRKEIARLEKFMETAGRIDVDWDDVIPEYKPVLQHLVSDAAGNVWVQREGPEWPVLEGFSPQGEFLGRVSLTYPVFPYFPPVVRHGWLLTVQTDSFDVQSVVGSRLPLPRSR